MIPEIYSHLIKIYGFDLYTNDIGASSFKAFVYILIAKYLNTKLFRFLYHIWPLGKVSKSQMLNLNKYLEYVIVGRTSEISLCTIDINKSEDKYRITIFYQPIAGSLDLDDTISMTLRLKEGDDIISIMDTNLNKIDEFKQVSRNIKLEKLLWK
jgi:hypothetical protein